MIQEAPKELIEKLVNEVLEEVPGYFLVQIRIKPTNNVKVFLDGDQGIPIEACIKVNRKLYPLLEAQLYPEGDFSLEVSSPGVGEPLLLHRQYVKNKDRFVEVQMLDGTIREGKMIAVEEAGITLESTDGKGKKAITKQEEILFDHIKTTTVQIKF
jgi:ribosome maturation factor RimP